MSYTITVRVYQTNQNAFFQITEKAVWNYANGGTWTESNGEHVLAMGGSGTSGLLRFVSDTDERFTVALGVHNYKRWVDTVTSLASDQTSAVILPQYYNNGPRAYMREKQLEAYNVTSTTGRKISVVYTVVDGYNLKADIIIG